MITNYNCGKLTFVTSLAAAEEIKKTLINLGADENNIDIKFVHGPNQYLVEIGSIDCEFPELIKDLWCYDNEWVAFRKIKYNKEKNEYL